MSTTDSTAYPGTLSHAQLRRHRSSDPSHQVPTSLINCMSQHPFFTHIPQPILKEIIQSMHVLHFSSGDVILQEGTVGRSLYVVVRGSVMARLEKSDTVLADLKQGAFFGEIGALFDVPRTATIWANSTATVAILPRDALFKVMSHHSKDIFAHIITLAQQRYFRTKPLSVPLGHMESPGFQMAILKAKFPDLPEASLESIMNYSQFLIENDKAIVAFNIDDYHNALLILVTSGKIIMKDTQSGIVTEHFAGEVVEFHKDASPVATIVASGQPSFFMIKKTVFYAILAGSSLSNSQGPQITLAQSDVSFVNHMGSVLGGATEQGQIYVDPQFSHTTRNPSNDFMDMEEVGHEALKLVQIPSKDKARQIVLQLVTLLDSHGISVMDVRSIHPNTWSIDLSSIRNQVTDRLISDLALLLGDSITSINISGTQISDQSLNALQECASIISDIDISDCTRLTKTGILNFITRHNEEITSFSAANCPGIDDECLHALARHPIISLDLSYCRNLGSHCWEHIRDMAPTIECLYLHRAVHVNAEAILESRAYFKNLRVLDLKDCAFITTNAMRAILESTPVLEELYLSFCTGLDETLYKALSALEDKPLQILDLSHCQRALTDRAIKTINSAVPQLKRLSLEGSRNITKKSAEYLCSLKQLERLNIKGCTDLNAADLKQAVSRKKSYEVDEKLGSIK